MKLRRDSVSVSSREGQSGSASGEEVLTHGRVAGIRSLAVATLCPHAFVDGRWWSYAPYVLEMNLWSSMFERLVIVAPVADRPTEMDEPYDAGARIEVIPFQSLRVAAGPPRSGVGTFLSLCIALLRARWRSGAVLLRAPSNAALVGMVLGRLWTKRIARYTGQWSDYAGEATTYRWQKRLLSSWWWRSPALVYSAATTRSWLVPSFNSVISQRQLPDASRPPRRAVDPLRVLFVGRLSSNKNVDSAIRAVAIARDQNLEAAARGVEKPGEIRLTIVGEGPERGSLEALAASLGLAEPLVSLVGGCGFEEVLNHYSKSDVFVLSSQTEGWPKVLVEAMAFGLVCIASPGGLMPEILAEGRGYIVASKGPQELADRLLRIARYPEQNVELARRARAWASSYTLESLDQHLRTTLDHWW